MKTSFLIIIALTAFCLIPSEVLGKKKTRIKCFTCKKRMTKGPNKRESKDENCNAFKNADNQTRIDSYGKECGAEFTACKQMITIVKLGEETISTQDYSCYKPEGDKGKGYEMNKCTDFKESDTTSGKIRICETDNCLLEGGIELAGVGALVAKMATLIFLFLSTFLLI